MTAFPANANAFLENGIDQGDLRQRLQDFLLATKQLVGAAGEEALTIASGSVTPTRGTVRVDTESAASTDNLDLIPATNLPDGSLLLLRATDNGRVVTVRHNQAGTGGINLAGGLNLELNRVDQWLFLQRRGSSGAYWFEVARFGREKDHRVGTSGEPAYQNGWGDGAGSGLYFRKESEGTVRLRGRAVDAVSVASGETIFTLPVGYRPLANELFPCIAASGSSVYLAQVFVLSTGEVQFATLSGAAPPGGYVDDLRFSGITFTAEA